MSCEWCRNRLKNAYVLCRQFIFQIQLHASCFIRDLWFVIHDSCFAKFVIHDGERRLGHVLRGPCLKNLAWIHDFSANLD